MLPAFLADHRVPKRLSRLLAGKGQAVVTLTWDDVHGVGEPGRAQLEAFMSAHPELGYSHDPFRDEWRISRPTTGNLFSEGGR